MSAAKIRLMLQKYERGLGLETLQEELKRDGAVYGLDELQQMLRGMPETELTGDDLWRMRSE